MVTVFGPEFWVLGPTMLPQEQSAGSPARAAQSVRLLKGFSRISPNHHAIASAASAACANPRFRVAL